MKVFIWILCIIGFTAANELLGMLAGFKLGYLILYLLCAVVAKLLCDRLGKPAEKKEKTAVQPAVPVSPAGPADWAANAAGSQSVDNWAWPGAAPAPKKQKSKKGVWAAVLGTSLGIVVLAAVLVYTLVIIPTNEKLEKTMEAIQTIGTVTMESGKKIEAAENLYSQLENRVRERVENYDTLTAARKEYDRLNSAVEKAKKAIADIGEVTLESKAEIDAARKAYEALEKDKLTPYLAAEYPTLTAAEMAYETCVEVHMYESGNLAYDAGHYEDAINWFQNLLSDYPYSTYIEDAKNRIQNACAALCVQAVEEGNLEEAKDQLLRAENMGAKTETYTQAEVEFQKALDQLRPTNGKKLVDQIKWGRCTFTITGSKNCDAYVKVESTIDASLYTTVFIRAGQKVTLNLADGIYSCKYTSGENWFGQERMFGKNGLYTKVNGTMECTTSSSGGGIYYYSFTYTIPDDLDSMPDNISASAF